MARTLDIPVFGSDNHLYETRDAFARYLPKRYAGAIEYVDVRGRAKIAVRGQISEYMPNPTFDVVARLPAPRRSTAATATRRRSRTGS